MDVVAIWLKPSDFVTLCFWQLTSFIITFTMAHNHIFTNRVKNLTITNNFTNRFVWGLTNDRFTCITRKIRFTNTQWFGMMAMLFTIWPFWQEFIDLLTFNGFRYWLTKLALQILTLLTIVEQTGLLTVNGLRSLLTLLKIQAFCLLTLQEHTALTWLHWYRTF